MFGLFEHEHKQSVLHFVVQRNTEYEEPVRSKDPLILCVGPRRYRINPIYSQHVRGGGKGANNVHKSERFLRAGTATVATIYGPIVFGKQPCLLLRETADPQGESNVGCRYRPMGWTDPHLHLSFPCLSPDSGRPRIVPQRRHEANHRQADHPHRSPLQGPQEDGHHPIHVLQPRCACPPQYLHCRDRQLTLPFSRLGSLQRMSPTSPLSRCTPSTDVQVTSPSRSEHTVTSRLTSTTSSTRCTSIRPPSFCLSLALTVLACLLPPLIQGYRLHVLVRPAVLPLGLRAPRHHADSIPHPRSLLLSFRYKRTYPKWSEPFVASTVPTASIAEMDMDEDA